jgi:catechol 2,3-dioxygenase-like lactoylglutathione lyase family enzyme
LEPRISLITLGVENLSRSRSFYQDGLGFPLRSESSEEISFFDLGSSWLALFPRAELAADAGVPAAGTGFSGFTLAHNVRTQEQVDEVLAEASRSGAVIVMPARHTDWGGYSGYFADPDGYLWEVAWNPHFWIG